MSMRSIITRPLARWGALVLVGGGWLSGMSGCAFQREWRQQEFCPTCAEDLEGRWEGCWLSHSNGHKGKLKAIITRTNTPGCYWVKFHATFLAVVPFGFQMPLTVQPNGTGYVFAGEQNIGALAGGTFEYEGTMDTCRFEACYTAAGDHGVFTMERVGPVVSCNPCDVTHSLRKENERTAQLVSFESPIEAPPVKRK